MKGSMKLEGLVKYHKVHRSTAAPILKGMKRARPGIMTASEPNAAMTVLEPCQWPGLLHAKLE